MIFKYRIVEDTDEGCVMLQCLACGGTWEWRCHSAEIRFCLFCGAGIDKIETRPHGTPRWLWDLQQARGVEATYPIEKRMWDLQQRRPRTAWFVEETEIRYHTGEVVPDQTKLRQLRATTAREVLDRLRELRHAEDVKLLDERENNHYEPDDEFPPWWWLTTHYRAKLIMEKPS